MGSPKPRIRASAYATAAKLLDIGLTAEQLAALPPGDDGWVSSESLARGVADVLNKAPARKTPQKRQEPTGPTMTVNEAYNSGRIHPKSLNDWQARYDADPDGVGKVLASLAPVIAAAERATVQAIYDDNGVLIPAPTYVAPRPLEPGSDTPLLDAEERRLFGPTPEQRRREQDLAAEANLRDQLAEEERQRAADAALSDEAFDALFGPDDR